MKVEGDIPHKRFRVMSEGSPEGLASFDTLDEATAFIRTLRADNLSVSFYCKTG